MKFSNYLNQQFLLQNRLGVHEGLVWDFLVGLPSWADVIVLEGVPWYFASRHKTAEQLPILAKNPGPDVQAKADTVYRIYRKLEDKGLAKFIKVAQKDFVCLNKEAAQAWHVSSEHSDLNPNELGFESESSSDLNPTNKIISINKSIRDKRIGKTFQKPSLEDVVNDFKNKLREVSPAEFVDDWASWEGGKFYDFYESKGWKVGKVSMKNWGRASSNWIRKGVESRTFQKPPPNSTEHAKGTNQGQSAVSAEAVAGGVADFLSDSEH